VPLMAPRLACSASARSAAVCSGGSQMSSQPHIRPAIGVMPYEASAWPISSTNALSPSVMPRAYDVPNVQSMLNVMN
jgi:hypothetical protein